MLGPLSHAPIRYPLSTLAYQVLPVSVSVTSVIHSTLHHRQCSRSSFRCHLLSRVC